MRPTLSSRILTLPRAGRILLIEAVAVELYGARAEVAAPDLVEPHFREDAEPGLGRDALAVVGMRPVSQCLGERLLCSALA